MRLCPCPRLRPHLIQPLLISLLRLHEIFVHRFTEIHKLRILLSHTYGQAADLLPELLRHIHAGGRFISSAGVLFPSGVAGQGDLEIALARMVPPPLFHRSLSSDQGAF